MIQPEATSEQPAAGRAVLLLAGLLGAAGLVVGLTFWTLAPVLVGWQPRVVTSGSMQPALAVGDVVLTAPVREPRALAPGQVVAVSAPNLPDGSYLHRLVRHDPDGTLVTRGDANPQPDFPAVAPTRVLGELRIVVPRIGLIAIWLQRAPRGRLMLAAAAGSVTALAVEVLGWQRGPAPLPVGRRAGAGRSAGRRRGRHAHPPPERRRPRPRGRSGAAPDAVK